MHVALTLSCLTALVLAAICRAARPGGLLAPLGTAWQWWLINRPRWLPGKPSGDCLLCTTFWLPGIPVALAAARWGGAGGWAACVPFAVAVLSEILILL